MRQAPIINDKYNLWGLKKCGVKERRFWLQWRILKASNRRIHKKDPLIQAVGHNRGAEGQIDLNLFYGNRSFFTDLNTAFAAQTFIRIHR